MKFLLKVMILISFLNIFMSASSTDNYYIEGLKYKYGALGAKQDYAKAKSYFEKSIENYPHCNKKSFLQLGVMYETGKGAKQDFNKAFKLYQKGAKLGHDVAQYSLGLAYQNGKGIQKNLDKAIYWYKKSIKQGYIASMSNISGIYYSQGNTKEAYKYLSACSKATDEADSKIIKKCQKNLNLLCTIDSWACK